MRKKILLTSVLSSFLIVGTMVGVSTYLDNDVDFKAEATNTLTMDWNQGDDFMAGQHNNIGVSYVDGVFENTDPIQKITRINPSGGIGGGGIQYQVGYYTNGYGSEVHFTNVMFLFDITEDIIFEPGHEPSFIRMWNWSLELDCALTISYTCVSGDESQVNNYPALEAGYYITGNEGVSSRGETWTPYSSIPWSTVPRGKFDQVLQAGTRFKITWYDGYEFNWQQPNRIEDQYYDAIKKGLIYQEPNGDFFVAKTARITIYLQGADTNKTMRIISYDGSKPIETTVLRLVGDSLDWEYNNGMRLYQDPSDPSLYHIDRLVIEKDKGIEVKFGNANEDKFGYQKIAESGVYKITAKYDADPSLRTLTATKIGDIV